MTELLEAAAAVALTLALYAAGFGIARRMLWASEPFAAGWGLALVMGAMAAAYAIL